MATGFKLEGGKEMEAMLKGLPERVASRHALKALRAGAMIVLGEARNRCPVLKDVKSEDSGGKTVQGALRDGLHISSSIRSGIAEASVSTDKSTHYGYMVEKGWLPSQGSGRGKGMGEKLREAYGREWKSSQGSAVPGRPFLESALEAKSGQATEAIAASMKESLENETNKGA
jgi:hypothetical protein